MLQTVKTVLRVKIPIVSLWDDQRYGRGITARGGFYNGPRSLARVTPLSFLGLKLSCGFIYATSIRTGMDG